MATGGETAVSWLYSSHMSYNGQDLAAVVYLLVCESSRPVQTLGFHQHPIQYSHLGIRPNDGMALRVTQENAQLCYVETRVATQKWTQLAQKAIKGFTDKGAKQQLQQWPEDTVDTN